MRDDLEELLQDQLEALKASSREYDNGIDWEAKRLSAGLRIILHDTASSISLLKQLQRKGILFLNTNPKGNFFEGRPITGFVKLGSDGKAYPSLDSAIPGSFHRWSTFDEWWDEIVLPDPKYNHSRKDIVLGIANKDGGAHIDPELTEKYRLLSREGSLGVKLNGVPLKNPHYAVVRQIAHEVLRSLIKDYKVDMPKNLPLGIVITPLLRVKSPLVSLKGKQRNKPCYCGSGKKQKKCHG